MQPRSALMPLPLRSIPPQRRRAAAAGFVLPLAISSSIVLMIGSASLHTLALQARLRAQQALALRHHDDQLQSVAMAFLHSAAAAEQACLLEWPSSLWDGLAAVCPQADPAALRAGELEAISWTLLSWQPDDGLAPARLRLALSSAAAAAEFRLTPGGNGLQLREGLRRIPAPEPLS